MLNRVKKIDHFTRNIIFVFLGTSFVSFLNLIYQLLIAHSLVPQDFAAFNSLLAIFMLISNPLGTVQVAITKYASEYKARKDHIKIHSLIHGFFNRGLFLATGIFFIAVFLSPYIIRALKIESIPSGYIVSLMLAFSILFPIITGALQGLELFGWFVVSSLSGGIIKIVFTLLFIALGYQITGALGAFLISVIFCVFVGAIPLRRFLTRKLQAEEPPEYMKVTSYLFPIAISTMSFIWLTSFDMVMVKYFFSPELSGAYSLAQMVGKIFLFLPSAISIVMFPKTSGLHATNSDTKTVLRKSLFYALIICLSAAIFYNLFPVFTLRVLTGKVLKESLFLGRIFSFSMTFFALSFVLMNYFLSLKDFRFIKYMIASVLLQFTGIFFFHHNLVEVQLVLLFNSVLLFIWLFLLSERRMNK